MVNVSSLSDTAKTPKPDKRRAGWRKRYLRIKKRLRTDPVYAEQWRAQRRLAARKKYLKHKKLLHGDAEYRAHYCAMRRRYRRRRYKRDPAFRQHEIEKIARLVKRRRGDPAPGSTGWPVGHRGKS